MKMGGIECCHFWFKMAKILDLKKKKKSFGFIMMAKNTCS